MYAGWLAETLEWNKQGKVNNEGKEQTGKNGQIARHSIA